MTTFMKFPIGVLTAEIEIDFRVGRGYLGGPTSYGWEPDEPGQVEIESLALYELKDKEGNEIKVDSRRAKKIENYINEKFQEQIDTKCYEMEIDYNG